MGKFANVLIVTDLDGTLLDHEKNIGAASREAIRYFMSEGGLFTFATGRLYQSFKGICKKLPFNAPVIFANGAQIINMGDANILYQTPLENDVLPLCESVLEEFPKVALEIYAHKRTGLVRPNEISLKHMLDFAIEHTVYRAACDAPQPWLKVLFTESHDVLVQIAAFVEAHYRKASICFSSSNFLEVFNLCVDKGRTALKLAELLDVNRNDVYAAGDQENDLPLLRAAKMSFAPANAVEAVKKQVDILLPDNDHDMMAALIQRLDSIY